MSSSPDKLEDGMAIAIVGMAGRFPGAGSVRDFWNNLRNGVESIRSFSREELASAGVDSEILAHPNFVNSGALAEDLDCFDAAFFGISKREAEVMDPQHRVFLEVAWEALESAGVDPERHDGLIGLFGGVAPNTYRQNVLNRRPELLEKVGDYLAMISSEKEYAITRAAFKLNLRGPIVSVNTACSTSAVALHLACQSLNSGESDLCLVGGGRVRVPLTAGYLYLEDGIPSPDGHCRAFDANARGTAIGNGVAVIAVKRLADALRDRDTIHAIIKSTAVNNDGADKVGFTAPSVAGQAEVIAEALALAGVSGDEIQSVEAHGTGTPIGDPIEVAALTKAFRETTDERGFCALGSVKTNIGHLDAGAGIAGVIKSALSLKHGEIPPSLNFESPNPQIDFDGSPFFVNAALRPWPDVEVRRSGVSSFGLGGTNAHIVMEEAPEPRASGPSRRHQLLVLSARSPEALDAATVRLGAHLKERAEQPLADIAYTLQRGRRRFSHRRILVCDDRAETTAILDAIDPRRLETKTESAHGREIAFLFPGGGAQYVGMGRQLYDEEAVFRDCIDECAELLRDDRGDRRSRDANDESLAHDIRDLLFAAGDVEEAALESEKPSLALPLLFSVEYALARLWMDWGIRPAALLGHSMGEYTAACISGVVTLEQGLGLVLKRGRLFETLPRGGMLSVPLAPEETRQYMPESLELAAINRPDSCVVSGAVDDIDAVERTLEERDIPATRIHIDVAAHSRLVEPILEEFEAYLRTIDFGEPRIPYVSNVTGDWITPAEARDPAYWLRHLRETVRFSDGLSTLFAEGDQVLLEVGPGQTLSTFARQHVDRDAGHVVVSSMRHPRETIEDDAFMLAALGRIWMGGADVDWDRFSRREERNRVDLPTYPFERVRHWVDVSDTEEGEGRSTGPTPGDAATTPSSSSSSPEAMPAASVPAGALVAEEVSSMSDLSSPPDEPRKERILSRLRALVEELTGLVPSEIDAHASFLELGLDSLMLTQANTEFQREFGVKITFRQLFESVRSLDELAEYIDGELAPDALPAPTPAPETAPAAPPPALATPQPADTGAAIAPSASPGSVEWLVQQQLEIMQQQLAALRNGAGPAPTPIAPTPAHTAATTPEHAAATEPAAAADRDRPASPAPVQSAATKAGTAEARRPAAEAPERPEDTGTGLGPWKPIEKGADGGLTPTQQAHIDELIARFNDKTPESKRLTQKHRSHLADPRTVAGYRQQWKEIVYPIWSNRSKGSKLWDVDGNEWIDITMGFGVTLFGHSPDFITDAIAAQLDKTIAIGPQTVLIGEVAEMLCGLTGMERAAFCNTGSEAVLAAMRTARTVTGREKVATFSNDYHGIFDEVLVKGVSVRGETRSQPVAPGIPRGAVQNMLVLDYGDEESLETIRAQADELAAVLVEPVQSRNPGLQPREFLQKLRALTEELGIPLIFDEMITGFRLHPGGAQHYFGVQADIATYGKVIGGGMPIGVVAGKARYLDALDAGHWSFGDDSAPEAGVTWFAGTFVRHPLSIAAAHAALTKLVADSPGLQEEVNRKAERFAQEMNAWFEANLYPVKVVCFSSLFLIQFEGDDEFAPLYWHHLRDMGIHTHERRPNFLTAAHSEQDMARLTDACKEAARRMRAGGFLPLPRGGRRSADAEPWEAPATDEQVELFLACQLGHDASCAFNLSYSMHFRGELDVDAMRSAIEQLIDRHDALRMSMSATGETLRFMPRLEIDIPFLDWSTLGEEETASKLDDLIARELEEEYDLTSGPLVRAHIARLDDGHHYVLFGVHHVASDGFSAGILIREIAALYNANRAGKIPDLPAPTQYTEYAQWQEVERHGPDYAAAEAWWIEHVSQPTLPPPLALPTDRPRPAQKTFASAPLTARLAPDLCASLKKSGMQRGCTMFSTLLGGFSLWLHRMTGQDDLIVGIPASGQSMIGSDTLVGHCAHHHPFRSGIDSDETVAEYLAGVQRTVLDAYEHRNYTEGTLVRHLQLPRDPSRLALVNVQFNMDPAPLRAAFDGLESDVSFNGRHYNAPDMTLNLVEDHDGSVVIRCEYNTDLLDEATVQRWLDNFDVVLQSIVTNPEQPTRDVAIMTDGERQRVVMDWNANELSYDDNACIHDLVTAQARRTPEAEAIRCGATRVSYDELDRRSNQIARSLQDLGVERESLVGLCMERTAEMVVAIVGIHKAGAAYLPLDPAYPEGRLRFMLDDSGVSAIVTQKGLLDGVGSTAVETLCVDADQRRIGEQPTTPLDPVARSRDLSHVIYTSGSTGKPKGVAIEHRSVVALLSWAREIFGPEELAGVLASTSICFDLSVFEIFLPLSTGGRIVLEQDVLALLTSELADQVTLVNTVPSGAAELVRAGGLPPTVCTVCLAGEPLSRALADQIYDAGVEKVYDLYGPSEDTTYSTWALRERGGTETIGRPIANSQAFILDAQCDPVPVGVTGELYLGGDGLARGYLNRPELTAERFIENPFDERGGSRLYRTGDLARFRGDGQIQCLGRIDQQVKIRGFRVELGEIEQNLGEVDGVRETAVIRREDEPGDPRLVAYLVYENGTGPSATELRDHLRTRLPDYMVPAHFVELDGLPQTPNGKLDRGALPVPGQDTLVERKEFVAATTATERKLASIWCDLLQVESIGVEDDFFDAGGHSLFAIRMVARVRDELGVELNLLTAFEATTISSLAAHIDGALGTDPIPVDETGDEVEVRI